MIPLVLALAGLLAYLIYRSFRDATELVAEVRDEDRNARWHERGNARRAEGDRLHVLVRDGWIVQNFPRSRA